MADLSETLSAVRRGDHRGWNRLVSSQGARLYRIARAVMHDSALAEDAVQEVFLRLAEGRFPRLRASAAEAYLAKAVTRAAIDGIRRRQTRERREEAHAMSRNHQDRPTDPLLAAELSEQVDEALSLLPADTRAALWLHVVEGEGIREVARCIGLARSTVADRVRAGKNRVRRFLEERGYVLPVAMSWPALLSDSQAADIPPRLTERLEAMGAQLADSSHALVSRTAPRSLGGSMVGGKKVAVALSVGLLVTLGGTLLLTDSPEPAASWQEAELPPLPVATAKPPGVGIPSEPARDAAPKKVQEDSLTEDLIVVDGIVFDRETLTPIAGATVAPRKPMQGPPIKGAVWTATSEADGHYRLVLPVSVEAYFVASARDFLPETSFIRGTDARWSDETRSYNFSLLPELEIRGWLVDADDQPLGDAELYIVGTSVGTSTTYLAGSYDRKVRSNEDGSFVLPMVKYGQPRVVVYKEGYGGTVAVGTPPSVSDFMIRVPPGATVSGRVVGAAGEPKAGERVLWKAKERNTDWEGDAVTDDSGKFAIEGLPAPAVYLVFPAALGSLYTQRAEEAAKSGNSAFVKTLATRPGERIDDVFLELGALEEWQREREAARNASRRTEVATPPPARRKTYRSLRIDGTVSDASGQPVHRARVYFQLFKLSGSWYVGDTLTDGEGRFDYVFDSLPTSAAYETIATVSHPAWATTRESLGHIEVPDSASADTQVSTVTAGPYSLSVRPGCNLTGRVTSLSGDPLPGVQVIELREGHGIRKPKKMRFFCRTDEAGGFVIPRRDPEGEIRFAFFHPAYAPLEIRRPAPGGVGGPTHDLGVLRLISGGTIEGIVLGADGGPAPYTRVTVIGRELQPPAMSSRKGRFVLEHVAPGKRELRVLSELGHPWKNSAPVEGDAVIDVADGMTYSVQLRLTE